jgi:hypothetical protein
MQPAKVTAADLDRTLDSTMNAVARLGSALFELDADRDRRAGGAARLRGTSAARWEEAGDHIQLLWMWYRSTYEALESLQNRRKAARLRASTLTELWAELRGPLVELPPDSLERPGDVSRRHRGW